MTRPAARPRSPDGDHVDQRAAALLPEVRQHGVGPVDLAEQVHLHHTPVRSDRRHVEAPDRADAHVIEPHVDGAEALDRRGDELAHRVGVSHVRRHDERLRPKRTALGRDILERPPLTRSKNDPGLVARKGMRTRSPNTARRPGDDDHERRPRSGRRQGRPSVFHSGWHGRSGIMAAEGHSWSAHRLLVPARR